MVRDWTYVNLIGSDPMVIARFPEDGASWRVLRKGLGAIMRMQGQKVKDLFAIESLILSPSEERTLRQQGKSDDYYVRDAMQVRPKLESAFRGGPEFAKFQLYEWTGVDFVLRRAAQQ